MTSFIHTAQPHTCVFLAKVARDKTASGVGRYFTLNGTSAREHFLCISLCITFQLTRQQSDLNAPLAARIRLQWHTSQQTFPLPTKEPNRLTNFSPDRKAGSSAVARRTLRNLEGESLSRKLRLGSCADLGFNQSVAGEVNGHEN